MDVLVTGGAGFIGSNFVHMLSEKDEVDSIKVLDKLTYAGREENLKGTGEKLEFVKADILDQKKVKEELKRCNVVFHLAAESHVDRSIEGPVPFTETNVLGTHRLLEASRKEGIDRFVHVSTDEVYGSVKDGVFKEGEKLDPSSAYSASKASADMLCNSYIETYGMPIVIGRPSNNYGPRQLPEKLIPKMILRALHDKELPIYGDGTNVRTWTHVRDTSEALLHLAENGKDGEIYNIASEEEIQNIEIVKTILERLGKPESLISFVEDRPGHDFRYALDVSKINSTGWESQIPLEGGLKETIDWYLENEWWWKPIKDTALED